MILPLVGKLEKNRWFQGLKQCLLQLNMLMITMSALAMVNIVNRSWIHNQLIGRLTTELLTLTTQHFSWIFFILLAYLVAQEQTKYLFYCCSTIVFLLLRGIGEQELTDMPVAFCSLLFSAGIIHVYQWMLARLKRYLSLPMKGIEYAFQAIYFLLVFAILWGGVQVLSGVAIVRCIQYLTLDHPLVVFLVVFLEMLLWYIGINGYGVLVPIVLFFAVNHFQANLVAVAVGRVPEYIFTPNLWDYFFSLTGSGLTGALVILSLLSSKKSFKEVGKAAVSGMFWSVSEPIVFGVPVVMNRYLFVPFVIGTPLLAVFQWFVFRVGWVNPPIFFVADMPLPLAPFLATLDIRSLVLVGVVFILAILMYYPFFKAYEKNYQEQVEEDRYSDLDLDF
ncbi:PTS transporter subunit EIIC [Streptococcus respiraculi]|uniref:PTS transporter subunit EIIC n=1 Tax=Streptococcus respiraculi TaxID=2021971 RepID=UPI0013C44C70|nr:PTS transporter subunit EIIC [Streptococcus respiraculi]